MFIMTYAYNTGEVYTDPKTLTNDINTIWQEVMNYKNYSGYDFLDGESPEQVYAYLLEWVSTQKNPSEFREFNYRIEFWRNVNLSNETFETALIIAQIN